MIFNKKLSFLGFYCFALITACTGPKEENGLFEHLSSSHTGIDFINELVETEELNIMQYEYLYNGGGVAIADFNGDNLPEIYFTANTGENKLYLNKGDFRFEDISLQSGTQGKGGWKTGTSVADVNGDGLLDIYVCYSGNGSAQERSNQLFINKGHDKKGIPQFVDEAPNFGLDAEGSFSTQSVFFDYDLDGDLDMFLLNHSKEYYSPFFNSSKLRNTRHPYFGNSLYRNDNGKFTNVSDEAGIFGSGLNFGLGVAITDINGDNWPDIYVSNDYSERDFLYINNADGTFTDGTKISFGHISQFSMGNDAADINNDGLIDLITLDMLPEDNYRQKVLKGPDQYDRYQLALQNGYHKQQMRNMYQLNRGNDTSGVPGFSEIGQLAGISATDWSWAPLVADFNNDGWKDLYITNGYLRDYTNKDFMKFEVDKAVAKVRKEGGELFGEEGKKKYSKAIYDLVKKMPSTKISNYMLENQDGIRFNKVTKDWGLDKPTVSTGAAYGDLDMDGDLDLVVSNTNDPVDIFRNNTDKGQNNYLKIKLEGKGRNSQALGSKIWVTVDSLTQYIENYHVRGYQSSVEPVALFGIGASTKADVKIQWPDGRISEVQGATANQTLHFSQVESASKVVKANPTSAAVLEEMKNSGISYKHQENKYVDFKVNRLALKQSSMSGPKMSVADVNADGLDDLFIGGAFGQKDALYVADVKGGFSLSIDEVWQESQAYETTGSTFFDADGDGDMDLYVVSGGSQVYGDPKGLQDRLYLNDGKGNFARSGDGALPQAYANGSIVVAGDYDSDGDEDLFVGAGSKAGSYPDSALGGILRNDTNPKTGEIKFSIVTRELNPNLRQPGIVTGAEWLDINGDKLLDLIIVGEWMPIQIYINRDGKLVDENKKYGLENSNGLWQTIQSADMDGDGDIDFIIGNMGDNLPFHVSIQEPMEAYIGDFKGAGTNTTVISCYVNGETYPIATLDELQDALPAIKKDFLKHEKYASAKLEDIFSKDQLENAKHLKVQLTSSIYMENLGDSFKMHSLPVESQFSSVQGINIYDFNNDNLPDVLLTGNYFPFKVEFGPLDAGKGVLLLGKKNKKFEVVQADKLGVWIDGDIRDSKILNGKNNTFVIVTRNSDSLSLMKINKYKD